MLIKSNFISINQKSLKGIADEWFNGIISAAKNALAMQYPDRQIDYGES